MKQWTAPGAWMVFVIILSVGPTGPEVSAFWPYFVHFLEYAILGVLLYRAIVYTWNMVLMRASLYAITTAFLFGAAMETVQLPLSHRGFGVDDMVTNLVGAMFGLTVYRLLLSRGHDE